VTVKYSHQNFFSIFIFKYLKNIIKNQFCRCESFPISSLRENHFFLKFTLEKKNQFFRKQFVTKWWEYAKPFSQKYIFQYLLSIDWGDGQTLNTKFECGKL